MTEGLKPYVKERLDHIKKLVHGFEYESAGSKIKEFLVYISIS
jgi:hypothetical protein